MKLHLRLAAGLLLLVQAFHLASLQYSTDSPGKTIDISWLRRDPPKNTAGSQTAAVPGEETEDDQKADATAAESSNDYSSGIASGAMAIFNEEEENIAGQDRDAKKQSDVVTTITTTVPAMNQNVTTNVTVSPTTMTTHPTNLSQINMTEAEEEFQNSTMTPQNSTTPLSAQNSTSPPHHHRSNHTKTHGGAKNSTSLPHHSNHTGTHVSGKNTTSSPHHSNHTNLRTTTSAPEVNTTQESPTTPDEDAWSSNATESNNSTATTTAILQMNETFTLSSSTAVSPSETTETSPATTSAAENTPEKANRTDSDSASGGNSERGLESDPQRSKRNGAWGAVLGTAVAVAFVGLVVYVILKKKHKKGFSHRKLVEEFPSDPVLRLDNSEPLDLNLGGSAYYNPTLQGDNIQMSNLPGRP